MAALRDVIVRPRLRMIVQLPLSRPRTRQTRLTDRQCSLGFGSTCLEMVISNRYFLNCDLDSKSVLVIDFDYDLKVSGDSVFHQNES